MGTALVRWALRRASLALLAAIVNSHGLKGRSGSKLSRLLKSWRNVS